MNKTRKKRRDQGQVKESSAKAADALFSMRIRMRDEWICQRCRGDFSESKSELTCSHFVNVRHSSCRFLEDNCIALCSMCHTGPDGWEYAKGGGQEYRVFMQHKLGAGGYQRLMGRKAQGVKLADALMEFREKVRGER